MVVTVDPDAGEGFPCPNLPSYRSSVPGGCGANGIDGSAGCALRRNTD
jgi:hypothetical protein